MALQLDDVKFVSEKTTIVQGVGRSAQESAGGGTGDHSGALRERGTCRKRGHVRSFGVYT